MIAESTGPTYGQDAFAAVLALTKMAVEPKAAQARLSQLQGAERAVEEARKQLAEETAASLAAIEAKTASARLEIEAEKEKAKKLLTWANEEKRALEYKDAKVREIFEALGVRDIPYNIPVDGAAGMGRSNPEYLSAVDQILMRLGKPIRGQEPKPDLDPNSPTNFVRPDHWKGQMIEPGAPKPVRVRKERPDPHFEGPALR